MDVEWKVWEVTEVSVVSFWDGIMRLLACAVQLASRINMYVGLKWQMYMLCGRQALSVYVKLQHGE